MSANHHRCADIICKTLLQEWRDGNWLNKFISENVTRSQSSSIFPSPDGDFEDRTLQTKISLEFKPHTETKRGIMTGLGQSIAYLQRAHASYLTSPSIIHDFSMGDFLIDLFNLQIKTKLPVGLVLFDGENLENIRIAINLSDTIQKNDVEFIGSDAAYWAIWRDISSYGVYQILCSCKKIKSKNDRSSLVWSDFFDTYYSPGHTRIDFSPVPSLVYQPNMDKKIIPFETIKTEINSLRNKFNDKNELLKELKTIYKNKMQHLTGIDDCLTIEDMCFQLLANRSWDKNIQENIYKNYKKNFTNFIRHINFVDADYKLTPLGLKFHERCEEILFNTYSQDIIKNKLNDELAKCLLVFGKHFNLIIDFLDAQKEIDLNCDKDQFLEGVTSYLDKKGFIAKNENRAVSGLRSPFQAEMQIWSSLNLILKEGRSYFEPRKGLTFNFDRIEKLMEKVETEYQDL
jgi:hypothetical protein